MHGAVAAVGVLVAGYLVFYLGGWGNEESRRFVTDLVHIPVGVTYTLLGLRVATCGRCTPRVRRAWWWISAAFAVRTVSVVTWFVEDAVLGLLRYPALADFGFILFVPLLFAGLLLMPDARRSWSDRIKLMLDALIVSAAAGMILWYLLLGPIVVAEGVPALQLAVAAALPVGDVLLVLALALMLLGRSAASDPAVRPLAGAVVMFVVADVAWGWLQLHAGSAGGAWPGLFWLIGDYLLVLAAMRGYRQDPSVAARSGRPGRVLWLPYGAIALSYGLLGYLAREQGLYPLGGMIAGAIALTGLVVARQMFVLRENQKLAVTDPLTGIGNRAMINRRMAEISATPPRDGRCAAVMLIDLDRFKPINDAYGHDAGDAVLEAVAAALRSVVRGDDNVGRLGGDEFAVVLRDLPGPADAARIAQRIAEALRTPVVHGDLVLGIEASIGVAVRDAGNPADAELLMHQADVAMYAAKRAGRSRCQVYHPALDTDARGAELRHAIDDGQLVLHYQPAVALAGGEIVAVEALVRWEHPARGLLMPGTFIGLAEETGAVVPLGEWVLREACRQAAEWRARIPGTAGMRLSVNLSPQQVTQSDLTSVVAGILEETGFPADRLVLEITESVMLAPDERTVARLEALRDRGIMIAVDDFGTGYSALSYLRTLPISVLKIDRSFITGIVDDAQARQIADAVVRLGSAFRMHVVAEGIETAAQATVLAEMGCAVGQGYHFHRPLAPDAATEVLRAAVRTG
ncbi:putative bifunctional diguanylate cyclase/phosphodiesterase [Catenuloplanes japonicus]|uniref:putative bifunctional diguanylate cyclase/phosphodiesterase n=1 Tax=Catenuloplanes japonicus TaxID=33876 RepID=UPI000690A0A6|nr:bifunctional diguanylate cyclase/phosphodiesterase [Catenuloplanes japonicus]